MGVHRFCGEDLFGIGYYLGLIDLLIVFGEFSLCYIYFILGRSDGMEMVLSLVSTLSLVDIGVEIKVAYHTMEMILLNAIREIFGSYIDVH